MYNLFYAALELGAVGVFAGGGFRPVAEQLRDAVVIALPFWRDALRLQEARLKVIREFRIEQHKQEEEVWRQKLRYALQRRSSRIAWGYDAQTEAARFQYSQANYLPLDRVRPATMISIRF